MASAAIGAGEATLDWVPGTSQRFAIIAAGEDERLIVELLSAAGVEFAPTTFSELARAILEDSFAACVITEEAFGASECADVKAAVERQPPWSDFPFVVISERAALGRGGRALTWLGNVSVVERPLHASVLGQAVTAALRARTRQREAVLFLLQRQDAEDHLRELTTTLEERVRERMRDLRAANQRLVQEVRERHAAEERLRESEELYRYTVELSQQVVWTAAPGGRMATANRRFYEVTGIPCGVEPHDAWLEAIHPDERPELTDFWTRAVALGRPFCAEFRMRIVDGSYRTFVARAAPRWDQHGQLVRWYGFTEDVTEQKRADAARREAEERYRLAAKATNDAIWDLDPIADRILWTGSDTAFFGYHNPGEITSFGWWDERVHSDDRKRVTRSLEAALGGTASQWRESYRFRRANGDYADVFDQGFIIRNEAGDAVRMVGAMSDLTAHKKVEAEVRAIQSELIHVSRLSAMGTMASTLAHEINQPLTAVSNYIRGSRRMLAQEQGAAMDDVREALEAAESAALRAGHIVKRLRELVARGNVSPRSELLAKVIQDASLIAFLDAHLLGVVHKIELDPMAEWVEVDAIQIQQVLINLVRNALQALEGQPLREVVIRTKLRSNATAEVSVADTGCGIPPQVRKALFSPFQSTKPEGIGVGLSISRTIVEAHGGRIWAEDAPGGGTIFRFTLPRVQAPDEGDAELPA